MGIKFRERFNDGSALDCLVTAETSPADLAMALCSTEWWKVENNMVKISAAKTGVATSCV